MTTTENPITRNERGHDINTDDGWCYDCDGPACIDLPLDCEGHPAGPFDPIDTVYCDGTCR